MQIPEGDKLCCRVRDITEAKQACFVAALFLFTSLTRLGFNNSSAWKGGLIRYV